MARSTTSRPKQPVYVLGVGMTKFIKPRGKVDYTELGYEAGIKAMLDAQINYDDVDQGVACYCYGDSTSGQRVFYQFGMTQIPIYNVNNNCSTGSTGLYMARTMIASGAADCVLVVGFEKMMPGSLQSFFRDRAIPTGTTVAMMEATRGRDPHSPATAQMFGNAGREYMEQHGATAADFAEIARINHAHSVRNPYSQFQDVYTRDEILASPTIYAPLTKLQCCPTSDGAAAAVLVSDAFLAAHDDSSGRLRSQAVLVAGQALATDDPSLFSRSAIDLMGYAMTARAARDACAEAGIEPGDAQVVEVHDCFSTNEMATLDAMALPAGRFPDEETAVPPRGGAVDLVRRGEITYASGASPARYVVNPSGGLISKGHPLGATGLAQCAELVWHLRGWATNRAVPHTRVALQHNLGLGGAAVVTVYRRADGQEAPSGREVDDAAIGERSGVGYNPAVVARGFTAAEAESVRSRTKKSAWALGETAKKVEARF